MTRIDAARRADVLEMMLGGLAGVFPGPLLEALIARMEAGR
jgi:hypothetical protein